MLVCLLGSYINILGLGEFPELSDEDHHNFPTSFLGFFGEFQIR